MEYSGKVLPIMRGTRDILMASWGKAEVVDQKNETSWSVVTKTDLDIEEYAAQALKSAFPEIVFEGEERGGARDSQRFWLMDPIDGTAHYVRGTGLCTSMLALIEEGRVIFSAIYDFVNDSMYWAEKGRGAFCNERKLQVSMRSLADAYIGFETRREKPANVALYDALSKKTSVVRTMTAGWEHAMVASGRFDARICYDPYGSDYDYAPGTLLISEAGGVVQNIGSSSYDYRNYDFIAANPVVFKELTEGADALFPVKS